MSKRSLAKTIISMMLCCIMMMASVMPSFAANGNDATLSDLRFNDLIVLDFEQDTLKYDAVFPYDNTAGEYYVPEITAIPTDPEATVNVTYPEDITCGAITVTVTAANGTTTQTYEITPTVVGENMYYAGDFEDNNANTYWRADSTITLEFTSEPEDVKNGSKAVVATAKKDGGLYGKIKSSGFSKGKMYYGMVDAKLAHRERNNCSSYNSYSRQDGSLSGNGDRVYYLDGANNGATNTLTLNYSWKRVAFTFDATNDVVFSNSEFSTKINPWGSQPATALDNYYLGELAVAKVPVKDENGKPAATFTEQDLAVAQTITLSKNILNSAGNSDGLEAASFKEWKVVSNTAGVTVDANGVVTVPANTPAGTYFVEAYYDLTNTGITHDQKTNGVKGAYIIQVSGGAKTLESITAEPGYIEVQDGDYSYDLYIPVKQVNGDDTYSVPVITATTADPSHTVDVAYPAEAVEGATATITVKDSDGATVDVYTLTYRFIGKNLYAVKGFEVAENIKIADESKSVIGAGDAVAKWTVHHLTSSVLVTDEVKSGARAWKIVPKNASAQWGGLTSGGALPANKTYYASVDAKIANEASVEKENVMLTKKLKKLISIICAVSLMITAAPVFAESDANLKELWVSGPAVIEFDSDIYEYDLLVPYRHNTSNGVWELVFPEVHAIPSDSQATVTIDDESFDDRIEIHVESADETTSKTYTLNFIGIGDNLYYVGDFEGESIKQMNNKIVSADETTTYWRTSNSKVTIDITDTASDVKDGSKAMYTVATGDGWVYGKIKSGLDAGKMYYGMVDAKWSTRYENGGTESYNRLDGTLSADDKASLVNYQGGVNVGTTNKVPLTYSWQRVAFTFTTSQDYDISEFGTTFTPWGTHRSTALDNYYLGELVVSDIVITDEEGNSEFRVNIPEEDQTQLQLSAEILNQHGHGDGLENEEIATWQLIGSPEGVSISDTGLLTIDSTAQNGDVYVEAIVEPSYSGAVQTKAKGTAKITICDVSASELSEIKINGNSLAGFDSKKKNYSLNFTCTDVAEGDTFTMPVIDVIPNSDSADVEINYPDSVDGGTIEIIVTSEDDITSTYYINMRIIGLNLLENGGFENGTEGWTAEYCTIEETTENPGEGNKSLLITGTNASRGWVPALTLEPNKAYITSAMVRLKSDGNRESTFYFPKFEGKQVHYNEDGTLKGSSKVELTGRWQKTFAVLKNGDNEWAFNSKYTNWGVEPDMVVDDYYVAELIVSDIIYDGGKLAEIPVTADGESQLNLSVKMLNQLGNTAGLEDESMEWSLKEDYPGVSISGDGVFYRY